MQNLYRARIANPRQRGQGTKSNATLPMEIRNLILFFVFCLVSCTQSKLTVSPQPDNLYRIIHIESCGEYTYIIHAEKNNYFFKIINFDHDGAVLSPDCNRIRVGERYNLDLEKTLPVDSVGGMAFVSHIHGISLEECGRIEELEKKFHSTIYFAKNLVGLCLK